MHVTGTDT